MATAEPEERRRPEELHARCSQRVAELAERCERVLADWSGDDE